MPRLRDAEQDYESQREEYERQRRYVDSYFAQVETNTPAATFDSSSSSTTTTKKTSGVSGSADVSTEQQFVYKRLDMPAEVSWGVPEGVGRVLLMRDAQGSCCVLRRWLICVWVCVGGGVQGTCEHVRHNHSGTARQA
jgi:hypothetical protein